MEQLQNRQYYVQFLVGKGSFGDVYRGIRLTDGRVVAIKEINKSSIRDQEILMKSINREKSINLLLKSINCPYFVEFLDYFETDKQVFFIYDFCEGQTLMTLMKDKNSQQKYNYLVVAMYQVMLVLQLLRQKKLIHRDIKPENILISRGVAKIADFGLARYMIDDPMTKGTGSSLTTAPYVYTSKYGYECDIWSLGITVHRCLFDIYPFNKELLMLTDETEVKRQIASLNFRVYIQEGSQLTELLRKMIVKEPKERITLEQFMAYAPFKIELNNFRSNNACLRSCLLIILRLHFMGAYGPVLSRNYIVSTTAFIAFSYSVMIYKEWKFNKSLKPYSACSRMLVSQLMLILAAELNEASELRQILEFMLNRHISFFKEVMLQLKATNNRKASNLASIELYIKKDKVLPRMQQILQLRDGESSLLEILTRNQRFDECLKNIDAGTVIHVYKFYYYEVSDFHKAIYLI